MNKQQIIPYAPIHPDVEAAQWIFLFAILLLAIAGIFNNNLCAIGSLAFVVIGVIVSPVYSTTENTEPAHRL